MSETKSDLEAPWRRRGACRGVDSKIFFPDRGGNGIQAKRICATCPVLEPCLEWALEKNIKHGLWGGSSEKQRRVLRRERGYLDVVVEREEDPAFA